MSNQAQSPNNKTEEILEKLKGKKDRNFLRRRKSFLWSPKIRMAD